MHTNGAQAPTSTSARSRLVALLAVLMLLLTACGARIDTELNLDADGSGSRVMTLTLTEDEDLLVGGVEAVDESIQRHLPEGIEYSGLERNDEDHLVTTLTVPFSSPEDYRSTMADLLAAGDQTWAEDNTFTIVEGDFVHGVHVEESFTSEDVLAWLFAGLLADGVVPQDEASNMSELGATTVNFDGISHERSSYIEFSDIEDNGFTSVALRTSVEPGALARTVDFHVADKARYISAQDLFDGYFATLTDAGLTVEADDASTGMSWSVGMEAADADELVELTNLALSSEETTFTLSTELDPQHATTVLTTVTEFAECAAICSPEAGPVTDTIALPAGFDTWDYEGYVTDDGVESVLTQGGTTTTLSRSVAFASAGVDLSLARNGGVEWSGTFTVPNEDAELVGDGLTALLGSDGAAEVSSSSDDTATTYAVTVTGEDSAAFQQAYQAWSQSPDAYLALVDQVGNGFFRTSYAISGYLPLNGLLAGALPADGAEFSVSLPGGQSFDDGPEAYFLPVDAAFDGSTATFLTSEGGFDLYVTGVPLSAWIFYGVLAALVIGGAVTLFLLRGRIAAARANRAAAYPAPAGQPGPWPGQVPPPPGGLPHAPGGPGTMPGGPASMPGGPGASAPFPGPAGEQLPGPGAPADAGAFEAPAGPVPGETPQAPGEAPPQA